MKKGKLVLLRAIEEKDLVQLKLWRNEESFKMHFREYLEINDFSQKRWFENEVNNNNHVIMFSIVDIKDEVLLGCCGLTYINWIHRNADLSLYIGDNLSYIDNYGYAKEAVDLLLDYGFNQLNLKKIWTEIYEFDKLKYEFLNSFGFSMDATIRFNYFYNGGWWNSYIFSILDNEFNKLNNPNSE
jgi:RimJ/RimL family protein N-acetyltransferase